MVVAGIGVTNHAHSRVGEEHAGELLRGEIRAVGKTHHAGVDTAADADSTTVMDAHPGGSARGIHEGVQERPVGDRVRAVDHGLGLAIRGCNRTRIQVVSPDHDRCLDLAALDHLIETQTKSVAFAVPEPTDARGQALERDTLARKSDPARERLVARELFEHRTVGGGDVGRITRERDPAEWSTTFAELRTDVGGQEAGIVECPVIPTELRLATQRVAVVEDLCTLVHVANHCLAMSGHRLARTADELLRIALQQFLGRIFAQVVGQVRERIMRTRLVGDDVRGESHRKQLGEQVGCIANEADAQSPTLGLGLGASRDCVLEGISNLVEVSSFEATVHAPCVHVDAQCDTVVHRHRKWLSTAHAAESRGQRDGAGQRASELAARDLGKALIRPLQDSLGADVDPRPGRHLAIHRETRSFEAAELVPVRPVTDEVRVRQQYAWCPLVRAEHADRLARLNEHRLIRLHRPHRAQHRVEGVPTACRAPRSPVDDEIVWSLGDVRVEVVLQHAIWRFDLPIRTRQLCSAGGKDWSGSGHDTHSSRPEAVLPSVRTQR